MVECGIKGYVKKVSRVIETWGSGPLLHMACMSQP